METCQIFAAGYPDRLPFEETVRIFRIAVFGLRRGGVRHRVPALPSGAAEAREACLQLMEALALEQRKWQLGKRQDDSWQF